MLRVACVQVRTSKNRSELFDRISSMVGNLMMEKTKPNLICLPEAFTGEYGVNSFASNAEKLLTENSGTKLMSNLAKKYDTYVVGGVIEQCEEEEKLYNTIAVLNPRGGIETLYRKLHLSKVTVGPDQTSEGTVLTMGDDLVYFDMQGWRVGLLCCFDLRFPAMSTALASMGCNVLLYPSAWLDSTGKMGHWETLLKARALDTQTYVVGVNTAKDDSQDTVGYGHSQIIDPLGQQLYIGNYEGDDSGFADFKMDHLMNVRENMIPLSSCTRFPVSASSFSPSPASSFSSSPSSSSSPLVKIAHLPDLKETNRASAFELPEAMQEDFMDEGFVFERDGEVYAFRNRCAHVTLPLDLDDEDFFSGPEDGDFIVCKSHGAKYQPKTGLCVDGPCKGKSLRKLDVRIVDNDVYLSPKNE